ncbi:MAG: hypothetical protein ABJD24_01630 [Acidimicrobiales bacterium]
MSDPVLHPRSRLAGVVLLAAVVIAACGGGTSPSTSGATAGSIEQISKGAVGYSLVQAQGALTLGRNRLVFGLVPPGKDFGAGVVGGSPQVWAAKDETSPAIGPFPARWVMWGKSRTDVYGAPPVPGYFAVEVDIPGPGIWTFLVTMRDKGRLVAGTAAMEVKAHPVAAIGSKALSEATPVATTPAEAAKIDTRDPPTPMHYISLDVALRNGLPTVVVFATPLLCTSRMCGPVVDEVLDVYDKVGATRANFVDVEVYPQRDADKPAPEYLRWGFDTEPWVIVIDKAGIIRGRFEGPSTAAEIEAVLDPLLANA